MADKITRTVYTYKVSLIEMVKTEEGYSCQVTGIGVHKGTSCTKKEMRTALKAAGVHVKPGATMEIEIIGKTLYSMPWEQFESLATAEEVVAEPTLVEEPTENEE